MVNPVTKKGANPPQTEFTKRQKNLIRAAVNGNTTSTPSSHSPSTPQLITQVLSPMSELHLHDIPHSELLTHDLQMQPNYAAHGGKLAAALAATRQALSSTTQSNPEMSSIIFDTNGRPLQIADYNSDSEISRVSPPSLRLCKGTPPVKNGNGLEIERNQNLNRSYNALESMIETGQTDHSRVLKSSYFGRTVNSGKAVQRFWNGKGKPPPSKLPVRSQTKPFIAPQISKPPSTLYRGRSLSNPSSSLNPGLARPSIVGSTSGPTQVVIGSGGMVSIPANMLNPNTTRNFSSIDIPSSYPINASVYTSASTMMSFQPLSVSQKPLLLPSQKEFISEPSNDEKYEEDEKIQIFEDTSTKPRKETVRGPNNRRLSKSRLANRRNSATLPKSDFANNNRTSSGKSVPGKKKSKFKTSVGKPASKKTRNGANSENEIGDVPTFKTEVQDDLTIVEDNQVGEPASVADKVEVADYEKVADTDSLLERVDLPTDNI